MTQFVAGFRSLVWLLWILAGTSLLAAPAKPDAVDPKTQRMFEVKIRQAGVAYEKADYQTAEARVKEADQLWPGQTAVLNLRGALLFKEKKFDEALVAFQTLIDREPNSYPGYFNIAEVQLAQKNYDAALSGFERILEARPGDEICEFRVVLVTALKGEFDEARRRAKQIRNPGQTAAYYFAHAAIEYRAGNSGKGDDWIRQSEVFFPAESSVKLRETLLEHGLIKQ